MDNQVEEIKQKLNIVDIINRYLPLKKRGRNHIACCPFHGEKTPSFTVSEELQIYKCFGCGVSGDMFSFLQEFEKITFREALEELAPLAGVVLVKNVSISKEDSLKKILFNINEQVAKFYNYILLSHPLGKQALDYVLNRGIKTTTIKEFNIGFSPTNPALLINFLIKKGFKMPDLIATGTFGKSQYNSRFYDRFQERLIFPLSNFRGQVLGFSGRILPFAKNQNLAKYINSPETEIYHKSQNLFGLHLSKDAVRSQNAVIVTEGEFDMISPYQSGIKNIIAIKGTAFTEDQLHLLRRFTDTLILALDSDFAGSNAAQKSIQLADSLDFDIKVLILGDKYKDPDEAVKSDLEFFKNQLNKAIPIWDFIIQSQIKINDPSTIYGKKEILSSVLPFLVKIKNSVIKSDYFKKLADEIGSSEESIFEESKKYLSAKTASAVGGLPTTLTTPETSIPSQVDKFEELLIKLILGAKNPVKLSQKLKKYLESINNHRFQPIARQLLNISKFNPGIFQQLLPAETREIFQSLYLDTTIHQLESKNRLSEIKKTINQIDIIQIKNKLNSLNYQITKFEKEGQIDDLEKVEKEYNQLVHELGQIQTKKN
ncbi:MAG: DNA primase [Candidatus Shapirobacteria bacterium]|nr:DNA primase [Candidatus Shapirobacteria bacterium]